MRKFFFPKKSEFELLAKLQGRIAIQERRTFPQFKPASIVLKDAQNNTFDLSVSWHDVVFKFECFALRITESDREVEEVYQFEGWDKIKCCFRSEWEYEEAPNETSLRPEINRGDGKLQNIPSNFLNAGATLVGIVFWNSVANLPVCGVLHLFGDTNEVTIFSSKDQLTSYMNETDVVDLEKAEEWCAEICRNATNTSD